MKTSEIHVLIGCEESQAITKELRLLGVSAFSNDLKDCTGGHPEWHIKGDVFEAIKSRNWSFGIFHPPCTFLSGSGCQWMSHPEDKHLPLFERREHPLPKHKGRRYDMLDAVEFVKRLYGSMDNLIIENPTGLLSSRWMKPTQIVQPYFFGDEATKTTCLWLKNMPKLKVTNMVGKGNRVVFESGKSHPEWYAAARGLSDAERQTLRSKTFPGMAQAMAKQWVDFILNRPVNNSLFNLEAQEKKITEIRINIGGGSVCHIDFENKEITFSKYFIKDKISEISFNDIKKLFVIITDLNNDTSIQR